MCWQAASPRRCRAYWRNCKAGDGWGTSPQTLARGVGSAHTRLAIELRAFGHAECAWSQPATCAEARLAEGEPGLRGSRLATGEARRETCEAPPIRHGTAVTPSPPGKDTGLVALGRGSPTVAPLRVGVRAPSWLREAATSCGGRRRPLLLLRPCTATGNLRHVRPERCVSIPSHQCDSGPPLRAQRGRPTGAARPPADYRHNPQSRSKPPPRGRS